MLAPARYRPTFLNNARKLDPARILGLRRRLERELRRRYAALKRDIAVSIVTNDCFGIIEEPYRTVGTAIVRTLEPIPGRFAFTRADEKVAAFMDWLRAQQDKGILDISFRAGVHTFGPWKGVYVQSYYAKALRATYEQGIAKARTAIHRAGYPIDPTPIVSMSTYMQAPFHVGRVGMIYSRTYHELKTVTHLTDAAVRRSVSRGLTEGLARGLAEGKNPRVIARELMRDVVNQVDKIGQVRALMIARTEVAAANHSSAMAEFRQAEVEGVNVEAEVLTSGLDNVCEDCDDLSQGGPYTLDEAENLLPAHPSCVLGQTEIIAPGALAMLRTSYYGQIVHVLLRSGRRLSVTPHHMLLTETGFAFAESLREGDHILCSGSIKGIVTGDADDDQRPVSVSKVFDTLWESSGVASCLMPSSPEDLHGDGRGSDGHVDVIRSDGLLWNAVQTCLPKHRDQSNLDRSRTGFPFHPDSNSEAMLQALASATDGGVGSLRERRALLRSQSRHLPSRGIAPGSTNDSRFQESTENSVAAHTDALSDMLFRLSDLVTVDDVVDIKVETLRTHVFDLQTQSSLYIANGVLSSNCACAIQPVVRAPVTQEAAEAVAEADEERQEELVGV